MDLIQDKLKLLRSKLDQIPVLQKAEVRPDRNSRILVDTDERTEKIQTKALVLVETWKIFQSSCGLRVSV
jgi:hypothetical protein